LRRLRVQARLIAMVRLFGGLVAIASALTLATGLASAATGDIREFPLSGAHRGLAGISVGPDGNLWFGEASVPTSSSIGRVGRMTLGGTFTEFPLTAAGSNSSQTVTGADGNIWFTEPAADRIGRITPAGTLTEFAATGPSGIALGPDGNVWFGQGSAGIGRITPSGAIQNYPLPSRRWAEAVTVGADGNIWFANPIFGNQSIGRLVPSTGAITHFSTGSSGRTPDGLAPGPDGRIWFTTVEGHVGRITTTGSVSVFPKRGGTIRGIVTGSDGNVWYAANSAGLIGRITPAGTVTEFPVPGTFPFGITAGPDGNIWFTEQGANRIGRLQLAQPNTRYVLSRDSGFVPASTPATQGTTVKWSFYGPNVHRVADSSGMGLFDSGPKPIVSFFSHVFNAAGVYSYRDPGTPTLTGKVSVPVVVTPASGTTATAFTIRWASATPATGDVHDVQIRRPGSSTYGAWRTATRSTSATFTPDAGPGTYAFRARLRDSATGKAIGYSAGKTVTVSP
jgi:streptogramin lyase